MNKYLIIFIVSFVVILTFFTVRYFIKRSQNQKENIDIEQSLPKLLKKIKEKSKGMKEYIIEYPIYYINMDKHQDRRQYMEKQLKKISKEYYRINGVNGYKINNIFGDTIDNISFENNYQNLSKPEIGCTLSHLKAIKTAYDMGKDYALICEDDICFDNIKLVKPISDIIRDAPKDWEILQLSISWAKKLPIIFEEKYVKWDQNWGAGFYLINKKGMEKIVSYCVKDKFYISKKDGKPKFGVADEYIYELVNTYTVYPILFVPDNTNLNSTIHDDHTILHLNIATKILKYYAEK